MFSHSSDVPAVHAASGPLVLDISGPPADAGLRARPRLSAPDSRIILSGLVREWDIWDVVIKAQKGLLSIDDLATWWRRAIELTAARVLLIRASHITALAALPLLHKDPFDRMLMAQAKAEGLALVTNDRPIREYPVQTVCALRRTSRA